MRGKIPQAPLLFRMRGEKECGTVGRRRYLVGSMTGVSHVAAQRPSCTDVHWARLRIESESRRREGGAPVSWNRSTQASRGRSFGRLAARARCRTNHA